MTQASKNVAVLGSTGSIGKAALEVIEASEGRLRVAALSAHRSFAKLLEQAEQFKPQWVIVTDAVLARRFDWSQLPQETELLMGADALEQVAAANDVDVVLAAIVGSAGLRSTWAAVDAGKTVALANKEPLVAAGALITRLAAERGAQILPVDSEHSAIFQALHAGRPNEVRQVVLTASGGPFRNFCFDQLRQVTVDDALLHPTWDMGRKITIDSATMMNKALEIIESGWLFELTPEQIEVVIHPQSIVHSFVEFVDGSIVAQLGPPDMKLPIQYALEYPHLRPGMAERLDWHASWRLDFEPADRERFPALELGFEVARAGGSSGAVLNAANEAAVEQFLEGELHFTEIVPACRSVLEAHDYDADPTLQRLESLDRWARQEVTRWVCA
jgi:1-deoxy-D-xylulose-5-phosphate reductoisomerase